MFSKKFHKYCRAYLLWTFVYLLLYLYIITHTFFKNIHKTDMNILNMKIPKYSISRTIISYIPSNLKSRIFYPSIIPTHLILHILSF